MWLLLDHAGIDSAPQRAAQTWRQFLTTRPPRSWPVACDYLHVDTLRLTRLDMLLSWSVPPSGSTSLRVTANRPSRVAQQARNLLMNLEDRIGQFKFLVRDRRERC